MSKPTTRLLGAALLSITLGLAACSSNDDDGRGTDGGSDGGNTGGGTDGGTDGMNPGGGDGSSTDTAAIGSRPADSDPMMLDVDALRAQMLSDFGDPDTTDPRLVNDGDTVEIILGGGQ